MAVPTVPATLEVNAQLLAIIDGWKYTQLMDYVHTIGIVTIVVDYLQTLPDEVDLMWPSAVLSLPRTLFFALRYGIFAQTVLVFYYMRLNWATATHCHWTLIAIIMSSCAILLASEAVLFVRLYAFSGRKRGLLVYLTFQFLILAGVKFTLLGIFGKSVLYVDGLPIPTCLPMGMPERLLGGSYVITFGNLLMVMFIMVYLARRRHKGLRSALFTVFYRDGMLYFACLSALAVFNCVVAFIAPVGFKFLFIQMETTLHAVLATRMLLHLRRQAKRRLIIPRGATSTCDVYCLSDNFVGSVAGQPIQFARDQSSGMSNGTVFR